MQLAEQGDPMAVPAQPEGQVPLGMCAVGRPAQVVGAVGTSSKSSSGSNISVSSILQHT